MEYLLFEEPGETVQEPVQYTSTDVDLLFSKDKITDTELICNTSWKTYDFNNASLVREANKKISEVLKTDIEEYFSRLIRLWIAEKNAYELYEKLEYLAQRRASVNEIIVTSQQIAVERENIDAEKLQPEDIKSILNNLKNIKKVVEKYETIFQKME